MISTRSVSCIALTSALAASPILAQTPKPAAPAVRSPQVAVIRAQLQQAEDELRMNEATQAIPNLPEERRASLQRRAATLTSQISSLRNQLSP